MDGLAEDEAKAAAARPMFTQISGIVMHPSNTQHLITTFFFFFCTLGQAHPALQSTNKPTRRKSRRHSPSYTSKVRQMPSIIQFSGV